MNCFSYDGLLISITRSIEQSINLRTFQWQRRHGSKDVQDIGDHLVRHSTFSVDAHVKAKTRPRHDLQGPEKGCGPSFGLARTRFRLR